MSEDSTPTLEALQGRVNELSEQVEELRRQLSHLGDRPVLSMRFQLRCHSCGHRKILHISEIADRDGGLNRPMAVAVKGIWLPKPRGRFMAFVCQKCGLVEWWVSPVSDLQPDGDKIKLLDGDSVSDSGPYR